MRSRISSDAENQRPPHRVAIAAAARAAVSQVGDTALVEREAVTLPLDHALGFELADVGPVAIEVQRQRRRADGHGLSGSRSRDRFGDGRRSMPTVSVISVIPVASR
jgi:hypothetical protein